MPQLRPLWCDMDLHLLQTLVTSCRVTDTKALSPPFAVPASHTHRGPAGDRQQQTARGRLAFFWGTQDEKQRRHMSKSAWQKMLKLPEERGVQERLSCEENWSYQSWCDFLSCPGTAWLATARRTLPPRRWVLLAEGRMCLQCPGHGCELGSPCHFSFPELLQSQGDELASSKSWLR